MRLRGFRDKILREAYMKKTSRKKKLDKKVEKKSRQKKKSPRGKLARIPGVDKGKIIIMPDFDAPLPEFD
jgi:hypothetical protein